MSFWRKLGRGGRPPRPPLTPELERRIREEFDRSASDEEHFPSTIDPRINHVRLLAERLKPGPGGKVLDAGCGKGRFARLVKEWFPEAAVVGLDISLEMLRRVRSPLCPCLATITSLPFPDGAFDAAYAVESLEHAVDIERAVGEICRVVRAGGTIVIIDKNREHWGRLKTPEWEQWFGQRDLERLLKRHARRVESRPISYWDDEEADDLFLAWIAQR